MNDINLDFVIIDETTNISDEEHERIWQYWKKMERVHDIENLIEIQLGL